MSAKVFLSHSSSDKTLVLEIYKALGERLAEYDAETFEAGLPNWNVITNALSRCDIFVLISTSSSLDSTWVKREIGEAKRRLRDARLKRILVFVIDGRELEGIPPNLRGFAAFLTLARPASIVRAIQRHLFELYAAEKKGEDDFVGRDCELTALKSQILDPSKSITGVSVSGIPLLGRSVLVERAMRDLQPSMHRVDRVIEFPVYKSCADIAIQLTSATKDLITPEEIISLRESFISDDPSLCGRHLYEHLKSLATQKLYVIFSDSGGIINDKGSFTNVASALIASAERNQLRIFFVTRRRPVLAARRHFDQISFFDLLPMTEVSARQYVSHKSKKMQIDLVPDQVDEIVNFGRGHPHIIDYILELCSLTNPKIALENSKFINEMSSEKSASFMSDIELTPEASLIVSVLNHYLFLPSEFVSALFESLEVGIQAISELLDNHVVVEADGVFSILPPLEQAANRDKRFRIDSRLSKDIAIKFARLLNEYQDDGRIPISIIDVASIASIEAGSDKSDWARQFIMPSHYIYLAKNSYNRRHYERAISYAESAISYRNSLTNAALISVCRTLGMSAARLGQDNRVAKAVGILRGLSDDYARALSYFIQGFSARLQGTFANAESDLVRAREGMRDDVSLLRELSLVNLLRGDFSKALEFADKALEGGVASPYILDIVARCILVTAQSREDIEYNFRLSDVLESLEKMCQSEDLSFFRLRSAERYLVLGRYKEALKDADEAVRISQDLATTYLMRARVHLAMGKPKEARDDRDAAKTRTKTAVGRHRFFESEILRSEIAAAVKSRKWIDSINCFRQIQQFTLSDEKDIRRSIVKGIKADVTVTDTKTLAFVDE